MSKKTHSNKKSTAKAEEKAQTNEVVVHSDSTTINTDAQVIESESADKKLSDESGSAEGSAEENSSEKKSAQKNKKSPVKLIVFIFLLTLTAASAAGAYYFWTEQQRHEALVKLQEAAARRQAHTLSELGEQLQQLKIATGGNAAASDSNAQAVKKLAEQLLQLNEQIKQTEAISQQAMDVVNRTQRGWALAEVDYLLRMAHQRIAVARDIGGAIAALKGADARLAQLADLKLFGIRKQLAKDIAHLQAIHQVDINGISLALDQVITHLSDLPFKTPREKIKKQISEAELRENPIPEEEDQTFFDTVLSTVKKMSDLEIHPTGVDVAISAEHKNKTRQLLRTYLLSARLAVLRFDQQQLNYEVKQALELLEHHYDENDNRVQQLKESLNRYAVLVLNPDLPELTRAWLMLQEEITAPEIKTREIKTREIKDQASKTVAEKRSVQKRRSQEKPPAEKQPAVKPEDQQQEKKQ